MSKAPLDSPVGKMVPIVVRVPPELARLLEALPNKSSFIREAVEARLDETCPTCNGTGRVSRDTRMRILAAVR